jgi:hypothetical protein
MLPQDNVTVIRYSLDWAIGEEWEAAWASRRAPISEGGQTLVFGRS